MSISTPRNKLIGTGLALLGAIGSVVAFLWIWQSGRDAIARNNVERITTVEVYTDRSTRAFEAIGEVLHEQRNLIQKTRETLFRVEANQEKICEDIKEIKIDVKELRR